MQNEILRAAHTTALQVAADAIAYLRKMPASPATTAMIHHLENRAAAAAQSDAPPLPATGAVFHATGLVLLDVTVFAGQAHISTPVESAHYAKVVEALKGDGVVVALRDPTV
ncbi:hypothetical protein [Achromobacter spanius]|uniref:hypothetical protein n=1 Tax=Achromobacter spanius TaxID=217203 RepID=UPI00381D7129